MGPSEFRATPQDRPGPPPASVTQPPPTLGGSGSSLEGGNTDPGKPWIVETEGVKTVEGYAYSESDVPQPPSPPADFRYALRGTERDLYKNFDFANSISADDLVDAAKRDIPTEDQRDTGAVGADPILEAFRDRLPVPPGPVHAVEPWDFGSLDDESGPSAPGAQAPENPLEDRVSTELAPKVVPERLRGFWDGGPSEAEPLRECGGDLHEVGESVGATGFDLPAADEVEEPGATSATAVEALRDTADLATDQSVGSALDATPNPPELLTIDEQMPTDAGADDQAGTVLTTAWNEASGLSELDADPALEQDFDSLVDPYTGAGGRARSASIQECSGRGEEHETGPSLRSMPTRSRVQAAGGESAEEVQAPPRGEPGSRQDRGAAAAREPAESLAPHLEPEAGSAAALLDGPDDGAADQIAKVEPGPARRPGHRPEAAANLKEPSAPTDLAPSRPPQPSTQRLSQKETAGSVESRQVHEIADPAAPEVSEATLSAKIERCFERCVSYLVSLAIKPPAGLDPHSLIVHAATIGAAPNPFRKFASVLTESAVLLAGGPLLLAKVAGMVAEAAVHVVVQHDLDHPVDGLRTAAMRGVLIADCLGDVARGNLAHSGSFKVLTEQHAMVDVDRTVDRFSETLFPLTQSTVEAPPSAIGHRTARPPQMVERVEAELQRLLFTDRNLAPVIERAYRVERNGCPRRQPCSEAQPCWNCRSRKLPEPPETPATEQPHCERRASTTSRSRPLRVSGVEPPARLVGRE